LVDYRVGSNKKEIYKKMFKFEGRTAVISGGAEGIGLSIAKALGEQKMNIVLADIDKKTCIHLPQN
jgi:short-subunit dehydrogenase